MDIRRFDGGIGVDVRNVDVCDPDDRLFDELQTLFATETLLVFRDQRLTYEQGRDLFARFGPLVEGIRIVTNEDATGRGELEFHSERSFQRDEPIRGLALYAQTVPAQTGATRFVDCAAAYRALPEPLRAELHERDLVHRYDPRLRLGEAYDGPAVPDGGWWTIHPAVLRHPVTGVPILYLNPWFTCGVVGMDDEAGGQLLARLFAHLSNPAFLYRHEWSPHDLVLWDNLAVMHAREPYEEALPRVLCKWEFGLRDELTLPEPHQAAMGADLPASWT